MVWLFLFTVSLSGITSVTVHSLMSSQQSQIPEVHSPSSEEKTRRWGWLHTGTLILLRQDTDSQQVSISITNISIIPHITDPLRWKKAERQHWKKKRYLYLTLYFTTYILQIGSWLIKTIISHSITIQHCDRGHSAWLNVWSKCSYI